VALMSESSNMVWRVPRILPLGAASALASIPAGSYVYDVELVSGSGAVVKPIVGSFSVSAEVTR
jgi:ribosomal protein L2